MFSGDEGMWRVWWLGGIPVALAVTALTLSAELLRIEGRHAGGDFIDVIKLLVYATWFTAAWRAADKERRAVTRVAGRLAVATGVLTAALTV